MQASHQQIEQIEFNLSFAIARVDALSPSFGSSLGAPLLLPSPLPAPPRYIDVSIRYDPWPDPYNYENTADYEMEHRYYP